MSVAPSIRALSLGLLLCGWAGCNARATPNVRAESREPAIAVRLAPVSYGPVSLPLRAPGVLAARNEVDLAFKVGGVVTEVWVDEGARVRKGQKLATVDTTEVAADVSKSEQQVQKAERDLARIRSLSAQNSVALMDVQNAETGLSVARAMAEAASFNLRHATITAPTDGVINQRMIQVGEVIGAGRPVFHLSTTHQGAVARVAISDRDLLDLRLGTKARVWSLARPEIQLEGVVSRLATTASPVTGTYEVEIAVSGPVVSKLPAGLIVQVAIERSTPPVASVPIGALVDADGDHAAVFVVRDARAHRLPVTILSLLDQRALLTTSLGETGLVVEGGAHQLSDGTLVSVTP